MSDETVLPIWNALRNRCQKKVEGIQEEYTRGKTIEDILYHTVEVEFMFAGWFLDKP